MSSAVSCDERCVLCLVHLSTEGPQASTMTELARAYAPATIPLGLHSMYADAANSSLA